MRRFLPTPASFAVAVALLGSAYLLGFAWDQLHGSSSRPAVVTVAPQVAAPAGLPPQAHPNRPTHEIPANAVFTAYRLENVAAIAEEADRIGLPPLWVLSIGSQEGGLACPPTCPTGDLDLDSRGSCGTFQIYIAAHGGTCAYWQNPVNAMREMTDRWRWAFNQAGGWDAFGQDVYTFLANSVPQAQGSIGWTPAIAHGTFRVALGAYVDYLQQRTPSNTTPPDVRAILDELGQWLADDAGRAQLDAIGAALRQQRLQQLGAGR